MPENSGRNSLPDNASYTVPTIQCLQKHYRPDGEITKDIQTRFDSSMLTNCHRLRIRDFRV